MGKINLPNSEKEFLSMTSEKKRESINAIKTALTNDKLIEGSEEYRRIMERVSWIPAEDRLEIGNATKRRNRLLIANAVKKYVEKNGILPSGLEIAHETGLSHTTVYKHQRQLQAGDGEDEQMAWMKSQKDGFIGCIMRAADAGDLKAAKLALDLMSKHQSQPKIVVPQEQLQSTFEEIMKFIPLESRDEAEAIIVKHTSDKLLNVNQLKTA